MKNWKIALAGAGLALTPLAFVAILSGPDLLASVTGSPLSNQPGSVGDRRQILLAEITAAYVAREHLVTPEMRNGKQLAPVEFINDRLSARGAKWRVVSVDGTTVETINIS